jgi:hypothetical protein
MSGLRINFYKSDIFCFGEAKRRSNDYAEIFTCVEGKIPFRYLGVPLSFLRLCNLDWSEAEEKMEKKTHIWKGKQNAYGGRLVLLRSCLSNVPYYMLSMFDLPKGPDKKFNFFMKRLFWQEDDDNKKYHLVSWEKFVNLKSREDWVWWT